MFLYNNEFLIFYIVNNFFRILLKYTIQIFWTTQCFFTSRMYLYSVSMCFFFFFFCRTHWNACVIAERRKEPVSSSFDKLQILIWKYCHRWITENLVTLIHRHVSIQFPSRFPKHIVITIYKAVFWAEFHLSFAKYFTIRRKPSLESRLLRLRNIPIPLL